MSELPSILITNGWKTDRNHKLTEVVIPSSVKTLQAPTKVTFMGTTFTAVPSDKTLLQEFAAPNVIVLDNTSSGGAFHSYTALTAVDMPGLLSMNNVYNGGQFRGCTALTTVNMPSLTTISHNGSNGSGGQFYGCTALTSISLPKLQSIITANNSGGVFANCTSLISVTLGSTGNPVGQLGAYTFNGCTQSGLTITVYTTGGASLSGSPWGATNATIVYETA